MNYFPWTSTPCYPIKRTIKSVVNDMSLYNDNEPVTLDGFYKIVLILDESGSMEPIKNDMIKSINDLIKEQQQVKERPSTFTLVKFNNVIHRYISNKSLNDIKLLSFEDYNPNGPTALYDAIGDTINWFRNEKDVLLVIVTDGQENSSKKYSKHQINQMIEDKKNKNNWSYVYLSNDLSTKLQGDNIGLRESFSTTNCQIPQENFGKYISKNLNVAITNCRQKGISVQNQLNTY